MKKQNSIAFALIVVLLAACSPSAASPSPPAAATQPPSVALPTSTAAPALESPATEGAAPTQAQQPEASALPVATSRGPDLHATDPTAVSLASGGLQFVEFFRFT
jgi:hypothetical protein